jgi:hypothetical protein
MFKKLLSNLPFNPSLIGQVSFYAKRMRKETVTRQVGLVMMALTMVVQLFAVMVPPAASLESSGNDIIPGGITSRENAADWCNTNAEIRGIFAHFGVSCQAIADSEVVPSVNTRDYDGQMYSLGRYPYDKEGETTVPIGGQNFYMRYVWSWGDYDFEALRGTRSNGTPFLIMFDCGNIIIIGAPTPPPPPPPPADLCPAKAGIQTHISECDVCPNVSGIQNYINECDVCPDTDGVQSSASECDVCPVMPGVQTSPSQCDLCPNISGIQTSPGQCDVCPNVSGTQNNTSECDVCPNKPGIQMTYNECDVCPNKTGVQTTADQCDVCPNLTGVQMDVSQCDVCPNKTGVQSSENECDVCPNLSGLQTDVSQCDLCPLVPGTQSNTNECKPCDKSQGETDTSSCIELSKSATNTTQNITNADGTIAKGDDVIAYTLSAKNTGKVTVKNFAIQENIGDILDYADVVNLNGGSWDRQTNIVTWPSGDILAGATMQQRLTVKIKNPIPQTPISTSNPGTGDMTLTNVYGNVVNIKLPPSVVKTTEQLTTQVLPNTGPGTSLMIGFSLTSVIAYFFARSKLFATELDLVRHEFSTVGGQ